MSGANERKDSKKVNGPWDKIKKNDSKQLRPPRNSTSDVSIPDTEETGEKEDGVNSQNMPQPTNKSFLNSTLNANAAEFIPLSNQNQNQNSENHCQDDHSQDAIVLYLKDELNYLILNPGKYDDVVQPLFDVLEPYINNENALQAFISVIIDECISEPNLRYNGARLCSDLTKKFGNTFRTVLLKRCQEEHTLFVQNAYSNDGNFMNRIQGFGILLAELFLQIQIRGGKSISALGQGLLKILQIILKNESEKGVKSVCQILKLAGKKLDEIPSSKEQLDELFSRLQSISNYVDLDPNLRFIVNSVLDMRRSHWGENNVQQSVPENVESNSEYFNDPVFFGPDGKIISEEETSFLQESVPFSEDNEDYVCEQELLDDETFDDFQRFLKMNEC